MFGIGLPEMILILALALIVVGPDKLPELARSVAKGVLELKKTVSSLKESFADENPFDSVKPELEEAARSLKEKLGDPAAEGWKGLLPDEGVNSPGSDEQTIVVEDEVLSEQERESLEAIDSAETGTPADPASSAQEEEHVATVDSDPEKEPENKTPTQDGTTAPSR
ncbi:MAG: twin-arginine translocase TatA/TatE family subunit [Desulfocapsaceae bacterium]|jgi:sec-independent protein translocase protein TatB|nr:twin-arginine translocase TatA/TatE family subunit [Desulfocapsaceae bacterium]